MSGLIPRKFIDDLLDRTDIVDVVSGLVSIKKTGSNYSGLCPFHDEKTPSFTVSQEKQFYHCFGCGANGTAITFLMEYNNMDFVAAVEDLASRAGMDVPREGGSNQQQDNRLTELYELQELAIQFYSKQLKGHPEAGRAVEYLKQRGLTGELAARFEIGYAPPGWDNLIRALGSSDNAQQRLSRSGLTIRKDQGGFYDRFRDRIMFPIRDHRGRAIGFGGRILGDETPKYLNSPETPVFHKGRELYGLYQARHAQKDLQSLFIVEGYMDVLALVQHGITNVAATLGTAATADHLDRVFKLTPTVIFCFDGDDAGRKAAWRALQISLPLLRDGRSIYFLFMPQGKDPDDFVRENGADVFNDTSNFTPLSDYLMTELRRDFNPAVREQRSKLITDARPFLQQLPDGSLKQMLIDEIASSARVERGLVNSQLAGQPARHVTRPTARQQRRADRSLMTQAIRLLLEEPSIALEIPPHDDLSDLTLPGTEFLRELVGLVHANPEITLARILENWRGTKFEKRLSELAPATETPYEKDEQVLRSREYLESEFRDALARIREQSRKSGIQELREISSTSQLSDEQKARLRNLNPGARTPREI